MSRATYTGTHGEDTSITTTSSAMSESREEQHARRARIIYWLIDDLRHAR